MQTVFEYTLTKLHKTVNWQTVHLGKYCILLVT